MTPGDVLLLYTDGVTEAGPRDAPFGQSGLASLLTDLAGREPQEVVDAVEAAARRRADRRAPRRHRPARAARRGAAVTTIAVAGEADLGELLVLLRGYCDFYEVAPSDERLLAVSRALIADPEREGVQLLARDARGTAVGFATLYWSWQTLSAARLGGHERPLRRARSARRAAWPRR